MLDRTRALLIDLDGVLYVEDEPIAGAVDAAEQLRRGCYALRFVTNTTAHSRSGTIEKLHRLGFKVEDRELITPAALAVAHCHEQGHKRVDLIMNEEVKQDFSDLEAVDEAADAVIVGDLGEAFGYDILNRAFRQVMGGAELIALQKNRYWERAGGLSLDAGPFVAALEYATKRDAYVVGKPAAAFFNGIVEELDVSPGEATMVGDDVETDIGGALNAGLTAVLVQTGKYREEAVRVSGIEPTATVPSITSLPALLAK